MDKINVIGLGYIGLPTALAMASNKIEVVGTDVNEKLVDTLNAGYTTFKEKGLDELFRLALDEGIQFSTKYAKTDMYIVAVPTPYDIDNKKIDPVYVINAIRRVIEVCPKGAIVVIESTIAPGTIDKFIRPEIETAGYVIGEDIHIVHAPERILPGNMIYELKHNSRTIGADSIEIAQKVRDVYKSFCEAEIILTDIRTAEMTKVVENTYRDINIAFANELTKICRSDGLNVYEIIRIANMHPRVNILHPGPGVGGHCISVDPWFLVGDYPGLANLILAARKINDSMPEFVLERINDIMKANNIINIGRVGLYGLTYKEDVDDVRESPTLQLLDCMQRHLGNGLKVYDPFISDTIVDNQYFDFDSFIEEIDIIVIMVAHTHIKDNMGKIKNKIIFDTRKITDLNSNFYL